MDSIALTNYLTQNSIAYTTNVDLKKKTWIHRGGVADFYIQPESKEQLSSVVQFLYSKKMDFLVVGHTSNIYILNTTNIPIVLSTIKCNHYVVTDNCIECESGVGLIRLAKDMVQKGIEGFEYLTDLPGTVGAALVNNSSCSSNSISSLLIDADVITSDGNCIIMKPEDFQFRFRTSIFKEGRLVGTIINIRLRRQDASNVEELLQKSIYNERERKKCIEGHSANLGCTMNSPFSLGPMPFFYKLISWSVAKTIALLHINIDAKTVIKDWLCFFSGCRKAAPYISSKGSLVFIWKDKYADEAFQYYKIFMRKVYRTESLEIQIF